MPDSAACLECGYPLRGLPYPVCPECGRPFDPRDFGTFDDATARWHWRRWATPPQNLHLIGAVILTGVWLYADSLPGQQATVWMVALLGKFGGSVLLFAAAMGVIAILIDYNVRIWSAGHARRRYGRVPAGAPRRRWRWWPTPLCFLLVASAIASDWPLRGRFHLSKAALDRAARCHLMGTAAGTGPQWVGLYRARRVVVLPSGVVFFETRAAGTKGPAGLTYRANNRPVRAGVYLAPCWFAEVWPP